MRVVFCASEVVPFAKTGGLADVCGALPLALEKEGVAVSIILPLYKGIDEQFRLTRFSNGVKTATIGTNIPVYFIENDALFNRDGIYGNGDGDYPDNFERFLHLCARAISLMREAGEPIDIIHCHDWHTALIPVLMKTAHSADSVFHQTKTILTIHNLAYQGIFSTEALKALTQEKGTIPEEDFSFHGKANLLKAGIIAADAVTTVSAEYAHEIQREPFGCGLADILANRAVTGIVNGLDYELWNPETDRYIARQYTARTIHDKKANKRSLREELGLAVRDDMPVFGFVGRLSHQKGLDLIREAFNEMLHMDAQMVFLGEGEQEYTGFLREGMRRLPQRVAKVTRLDEAMAHKIYAGCDIFLMPSVFEPCGLSQLISFRYGTIPLVYRTGGLKETVMPFDEPGGNGFTFDRYDTQAFLDAIEAARIAYTDTPRFTELCSRVMGLDFSWNVSARKYVTLYAQCREKKACKKGAR